MTTSGVRIDDPNDKSQERRKRTIHDRQEQAAEVKQRISDPGFLPHATNMEKQHLYFEVVKSYVVELEPTLTRDGLDVGNEYWEEMDLGTITFQPPAEAVDLYKGVIARSPPGASHPQSRAVRITGLSDFADLSPPFEQTWTVIWKPGSSLKDEDFTIRETVPQQISEKAYRACNKFLAEVDLGLQMSGNDYTPEEPGL